MDSGTPPVRGTCARPGTTGSTRRSWSWWFGLAAARPADIDENLHLLGALLIFIEFNLGPVAAAFARRDTLLGGMRTTSAVLGTVALTEESRSSRSLRTLYRQAIQCTTMGAWVLVGKLLAVFLFLNVMTVFVIVFERKVVARMQVRLGPNRVGPGGWLQSLADGLKLILKEDIRPVGADRVVYAAAPVIAVVCAFTAFSVIPFGPVVSVFGVHTQLQLADPPVGILVALACSSMGVYGVVLAGWASGSTYSLLGGLRSAAQVISYEVVLALSVVTVVLTSGSLRTSEIVAGQAGLWYGVALLPSMLSYLVSGVGETNRAPFDLAEAESELVGGFHTEYSSIRFMLLFLAEYINVLTVCALCTTLFLGGWRAPWPLSTVADGVLNTGWWPLVWFLAKLIALIFVFVWLRGTLPRMRYDRYMRLSWRVLLPANLAWIVCVAGLRVM